MARRFARWLAFFLLIVGWFAPQRAQGEPQRATLTLTREPGANACMGGAELAKQVDLLAGTPVIASTAGIAVSVTIRPEKNGYRAHIVLTGDRAGERTLDDDGPGCEVLGRALVVTIAILLDAGPAASVAQPTAPSVPSAPSLPSAPPTRPPSARPRPPSPNEYFVLPEIPKTIERPRPRGSRMTLSGSAAAIYDVGTLVDDAGGFTIGAELWIPHFGIGAGLMILPLDRLTLGEREVDYRLVAARVELCSKPPFELPFGIAVCSGLLAGERHALASGAAATSAALVTFETRLELSRRFLGPFGVFATAGFQAPVLHESVAVKLPRRSEPIRGPDAGVTFQTGLGARFWLDL